MDQFKFKSLHFWFMKAANIFQTPFRQGLFQLCPNKFSFNSTSLDNEISNRNNFISCGYSLQAWHFCTVWMELPWFTLMVFTTKKKTLAERSGWHREEKSFPENPLFSPPCITWAQGGADTGGSVAQPRCFTLHPPLEVLLTGDAGQILNICHWSELLRDVLTVRIATSCTYESPDPAIFRVLKF